jgi:hypothetical protein
MKAYVGMDVQLHPFLTSALDGSKWLASRTGRLSYSYRRTKARKITWPPKLLHFITQYIT